MSTFSSPNTATPGNARSSTDRPDSEHIAEFARVEPWLFRGDQPDAEGYRWLLNHGVSTVVNLRMHNIDKQVSDATDGLRSVHIPVPNDYAPSEKQALMWLALCHDRKSTDRIFVHCRGGKGRTSAFCALVRIAQGWDVEAAINEQRNFGFEPDREHKVQAEFLEEFAARVRAGSLAIPKL